MQQQVSRYFDAPPRYTHRPLPSSYNARGYELTGMRAAHNFRKQRKSSLASELPIMENHGNYISLASFEVKLLEQVSQPPTSDNLYDKADLLALFKSWVWSSEVVNEFRDHLSPEALASEYEGDIDLAYRNCLHTLSHQGVLAQSRFRAIAFERLNPKFLSLLKSCSIEDIEFEPAPMDLKAWDVLMCMDRHQQSHFSGVQFHREGTFDIFKSVYSHQHSLVSPANPEHRVVFLIAVTEHWEVELAAESRDSTSRGQPIYEHNQRYRFRSKHIEPSQVRGSHLHFDQL